MRLKAEGFHASDGVAGKKKRNRLLGLKSVVFSAGLLSFNFELVLTKVLVKALLKLWIPTNLTVATAFSIFWMLLKAKINGKIQFNLTCHHEEQICEWENPHSYFRWFSAIGGLSLATAVKLWSSQLLRLVWPVRLVTCNEFVETRSDSMHREKRAVCCIIASLIFERMSYNGMSGEDKTEPTAKLEIPKISWYLLPSTLAQRLRLLTSSSKLQLGHQLNSFKLV